MSRRAARLETQRLVPSTAALRPSRVVANFHVTKGRPCSTAKVQVRLIARASSASRPASTSMPASRNRAAPPSATGLTSVWANTTRRTPAAISACEQGPVRPVWLHGSRVTTAVVPRAESPAARRASTSAWGMPAPRWKPSATVVPSGASSTQPTRGLGPRGTPGVTASASARRMALRSASLVVMSASRSVDLDSGGRATVDAIRRWDGVEPSACTSHPDCDRRSRSSTWSTGHWRWSGRGL